MSKTSAENVRFAVLGPVLAWFGEREVDLGSPQQRAVLAALLLRRGQQVTVGELVHAVWGKERPAAAVSVLRTYVSRLRKVLEPEREAGAGPRLIVSAADGYQARVSEHALDLHRFEHQVAEARRLRAAGETAVAGDLLHSALGLWQGTPLAGLPGPLAAAERARLAEQHLGVLEFRLDTDLQLGRHADLIGELDGLTGEHSLREELWRLLMLALYRSGRQADALAAYRRSRGVLVRELGIEPGAALRDLHDRILTGDPSLDLVPPIARPGPAEPARPTPSAKPSANAIRPAQLPADLRTFTGRHQELEEVRALLPGGAAPPAAVVISAIGGMAGIGKTALAVHWAHEIAHRYPDGQLYVNLRGFDSTGSVVPSEEALRTFLDALGVPPERIPTTGLDAQAALYRSLLAERRVLVLLDNARDTEQVRPLLPGAPGCLVIVTSRNRLTGLIANDGARPLTLHPLAPGEALDFLHRRLGTARVTAEPKAVDDIIERCARLPLALAVVAARATTNPHFALAAIAGELADSRSNLDAFTGGDLSADVQAAFSWSYEALSAPAARLFRLLGLHSGQDVSTPAAAALAGLPPRQVRPLLIQLTSAHLLTEYRPGRYSLHDLLRVFAAEQARTDGAPEERDRAVERMLTWYLHTANAADILLSPHSARVPLDPLPPDCGPLEFTTPEQALHWCETERANLVAAVHLAAATGHPGIAWRLSATLWTFFHRRLHAHDWYSTNQVALAAATAAGDLPGQATAHNHLAGALMTMRRLEQSITHFRRTIELNRMLGNSYNTAMGLSNLGTVYLEAGQLRKSVEYLRRALARIRVADAPWAKALVLANLGDAYQRLGLFDQAIDCLKEALSVVHALGDHWIEGVALDILGTVYFRLRRHDEAFENYHQALERHRGASNRGRQCETLRNLGDLHLAVGDRDAARSCWQQALTLLEEVEEFDHPEAETLRARLRALDSPLPTGNPAGTRPCPED
ncbi:BTAD domain-containing putative transcriptional regulator [Streptomyces sp. NPDC047061]|uniref:AfsR/SARP family transcriptional regulator n=1 Tax=Streptomyces sp. NPDC047061 TaxID=3154605 RepID=UPI00340B4BC6